ncbi:MAG: hypothetical protein GY835_19385 [bacterium]|nr:hypothetical protein [bacterium]
MRTAAFWKAALACRSLLQFLQAQSGVGPLDRYCFCQTLSTFRQEGYLNRPAQPDSSAHRFAPYCFCPKLPDSAALDQITTSITAAEISIMPNQDGNKSATAAANASNSTPPPQPLTPAEQQEQLLRALQPTLTSMMSSDSFLESLSTALSKKGCFAPQRPVPDPQNRPESTQSTQSKESASSASSSSSGQLLSLPLAATIPRVDQQPQTSAAASQLLPIPLGSVSGHDSRSIPLLQSDEKTPDSEWEESDGYSDITDSEDDDDQPRKKKRRRHLKSKPVWKVPNFADTNDCQWKAGLESINRMRYVALAKITTQVHNFRVAHVDSTQNKEAMAKYNEIQEGIELEMNYIRLADSDPEGWGIVREIQRGGPNINNKKLLQTAARAGKRLRKRKADAKATKQPFRERSGGYGAPRGGRQNRGRRQESAHSSQQQDDPPTKQQQLCYTCGAPSHFSRHCPQRKNSRGGGGAGSSA